nr:MAG TPA: DNA-directed RNA polymerase [Caudoviricetes sp.]
MGPNSSNPCIHACVCPLCDVDYEDCLEYEPVRECRMEYNEDNSNDELYPTEAYKCSQCGFITLDGLPKFCPECGAKVKGEVDGQ